MYVYINAHACISVLRSLNFPSCVCVCVCVCVCNMLTYMHTRMISFLFIMLCKFVNIIYIISHDVRKYGVGKGRRSRQKIYIYIYISEISDSGYQTKKKKKKKKILDSGYHEIAMTVPELPRKTLLTDCRNEMDLQFEVRRTPGLILGAYLSFKDEVIRTVTLIAKDIENLELKKQKKQTKNNTD